MIIKIFCDIIDFWTAILLISNNDPTVLFCVMLWMEQKKRRKEKRSALDICGGSLGHVAHLSDLLCGEFLRLCHLASATNKFWNETHDTQVDTTTHL
jgi:hypothetical protein